MHLGNNQWCVVDSCTSRGKSLPVAIEYLDGFKNNALGGLGWILATHWHDDHIRGLADLVERAPKAEFYCSVAVRSTEFTTLAATALGTIQGNSGIDEFARILGLLGIGATAKQQKLLATPKWAVENRRLIHLPKAGRSFDVSVTALSPSDGTIGLALKSIAALVPRPGAIQRRIPSPSPNHASVVLWVEAGALRFLLGADLEHTEYEGEGWTAVLQCHEGRHEQTKAGFFKVPHHGSENADNQKVWQNMLGKDPIAVVTPYNGGSTKLPRKTDLERLSQRTSSLFCTSAGAGKEPSRDASINRTMRQHNRKVLDGQPGQVRIRWSPNNPGDQPQVEMFSSAYKV